MYIADLHIHSKYSRATSAKGVPEYLELWARKKGIGLLGTGDFTHPAWRQELKEKLAPAEEGLYRLRDSFRLPDEADGSSEVPRFVLSGEISSIYKKNGKVRKVHNVILLPSLDKADELSRKLEAIGNIHSDGRPILGLDSRDLLEITLETCPEAVFIPAHIWTPHFSLFGAFSGFDTIAECFEDLTPYIHALETGLSSDPAMNWRLSALDGYTLVSNSDAHSPNKLGREANLLDTERSYPAMAKAIQTGEGFGGTIEFFPEEGKYHLDGHRKCDVCLTPAETIGYGGKCPVCGRKITIGVQHRVEELADRPEGYTPENAAHFESLVPLQEVIASSLGISPAGKKAEAQYERMLKTLGPEFYILRQAPIEDIGRVMGPCVAEGISRLRAGRVERIPGYDGEYGKITLLNADEIEKLNGQLCLLSGDELAPVKKKKRAVKTKTGSKKDQPDETAVLPDRVNAEQESAVKAEQAVVAVIAGPGTGKTKTLIARIADLVENRGVKPAEITAVTFTNKAAGELRERLLARFGTKKMVSQMHIGTFHGLCLQILSEANPDLTLIDEYEAAGIAAAIAEEMDLQIRPRRFLQAISAVKNGKSVPDFPQAAYTAYCKRLGELGVLDFDDLLTAALDMDSQNDKRFHYLLVDEFQDINPVQFALIKKWHENGKSLFVIGDPDQSIYGFRGSDAECFAKLQAEYPALEIIRLKRNYRSAPAVLRCALPLIGHNPGGERILAPQRPEGEPVQLYRAESELSEGIFIAKEINRMVGGIDMLDAHRCLEREEAAVQRSFSDIAVLYRTHRQARLIEKCLQKESIPYIVSGRDDLLADEVVRGTVGFFRWLVNPQDTVSLRACLETVFHCPADMIAQAVAGKDAAWIQNTPHLKLWAELTAQYRPRLKKEPPLKLLEDWKNREEIPESGALEQLLNMAVFYSDMPSFLQNLLLGTESDIQRSANQNYTADAVRLMTFHGAKGLEFPVVFLCGIEQGKVPLESMKYPTDIAEERRLFYVGITRAKDRLVMVGAKDAPSPFLAELPAAAYTVHDTHVRQPQTGKQLSLFD